jgi:hypothetical protein
MLETYGIYDGKKTGFQYFELIYEKGILLYGRIILKNVL